MYDLINDISVISVTILKPMMVVMELFTVSLYFLLQFLNQYSFQPIPWPYSMQIIVSEFVSLIKN